MQIRDIIKLLEKADIESNKIDRSAFLYLESNTKIDEFAQCSTCLHFMPNAKRCTLFGEDDEVVANASCGIYTQGLPSDNQKIIEIMTPEDAGYILGQVRCENCVWLKDDICDLFKLLNEKLPDVFDLDIKVSKTGCCNGFQK